MLKWLDIPPVWLIGFLVAAWWQSAYLSFGLSFGGKGAQLLGGLLVGAGVLLIVLAAIEFRRRATTIIPHREADNLVTRGVFRFSRNPIYLGDVLILTGLVLRWDAVLSLVLIPVLVWILERRFILPEEDRLRRKFRLEFARYERRVRRWV